MRRGVMGADRAPPGMIAFELQRRARLQRALLHVTEVHEQIARLLLGIGDTKPHALAGQHAGVANLAAGLRIKRRLVQNDGAGLASLEAFDIFAVPHQSRHHAFGARGLIAEEFRGAEFCAQWKPHVFAGGIAGARPCRAKSSAPRNSSAMRPRAPKAWWRLW